MLVLCQHHACKKLLDLSDGSSLYPVAILFLWDEKTLDTESACADGETRDGRVVPTRCTACRNGYLQLRGESAQRPERVPKT